MRKALLAVSLALWLTASAQAAPETRILYASDWTGQMEVFAVDPSGKAPAAQLTHWHGRCSDPQDYAYPYGPLDLVSAPNGRYLLVRCGTALWLMRGDGSAERRVVAPGRQGVSSRPSWSRDSRQFAYSSDGTTHVFDAIRGRELGPGEPRSRAWTNDVVSPNGRWSLRALGPDGIDVVNTRTGHVRRLTNDIGLSFAWAPDSRSIAYAPGEETFRDSNSRIASGDLSVVSLAGRVRRIVSVDRAYGGRMTDVSWTKLPRGLRYAPPEPAPRERVEVEGLLADGAIHLLAADGQRVAYEACDNVAVWTPSSKTVETVHRSAAPRECVIRDRYLLYDLALAGDRVAYALSEGCMAIRLTLFVATVGAGRSETAFQQGDTNCGAPYWRGVGRLAASGDLLVFDDWHEMNRETAPYFETTSSTVRRLDGAACPCPDLASTPGPLYPGDVQGDRVVAYGDNATLVVDRDGRRLLSLAVVPAAAQLWRSELLLVVRGRLLVYDVRSAELLHSWPLPDAPAGPFCLWRTCPPHELTFQDAARGLAAYTFDGELHLLRTADGADSLVGDASVARFMDTGLVYADGARLRLVPFSRLPLTGF